MSAQGTVPELARLRADVGEALKIAATEHGVDISDGSVVTAVKKLCRMVRNADRRTRKAERRANWGD